MDAQRMNRLKEDPRSGFNEAIAENDIARCLVKTAEIHGHYCPGSAFGVMASLLGLKALQKEMAKKEDQAPISSKGMETLMALVETNGCFCDGVQAVSGCSLGNNALVYRDMGKLAVTFALRTHPTAVRLCIKGGIRDHVDRVQPDFFPLMEKVIKDRAGTSADEASFRQKGKAAAFGLIQHPPETYFTIQPIPADLPPYAPIAPSLTCPGCGEAVMATKTIASGSQAGLCFSCAQNGFHEVQGQGIVINQG